MRKDPITRRSFILAGSSVLALMPGGRLRAEEAKRRFRLVLWNDVHVRDTAISGRAAGYPRTNEKALWLFEWIRRARGNDAPDFVLSAGDIIDGEISDMGRDFAWLREHVLEPLPVPFLPCVGNHENGQGEGVSEAYTAYDACFGSGWRNYIFTAGGIGFLVVDTSGAHRSPDEITAARNAFVERAFERLNGMPVIVVTHVPLVSMREEEVLKKSFGFSSWRVLDPRMLQITELHRDRVVAVLSGHLHLTAARKVNGILHVTSTGTASYPSTFSVLDCYDDRLEFRIHELPDALQDRGADIHGKPRYDNDYIDAQHPAHEAYVGGNPEERAVTLPLEGFRRPADSGPRGLCVYHETMPGEWTLAGRTGM